MHGRHSGGEAGAIIGGCGAFAYRPDTPGDSVTIDVLIARVPADSSMRSHIYELPVPEQALDTLRAIGARVIYRFHLPYVRIRMRKTETARLEGIADLFRQVPDPEQHAIDVVVTYWDEPTDRDVRRFLGLGGIMDDRGRWDISGSLPDESIERLRRERTVESIQATGVACVTL